MILKLFNKIPLNIRALSIALGSVIQFVAAEKPNIMMRDAEKVEIEIPETQVPGKRWGHVTEKAAKIFASKLYWISRCFTRPGKICVSSILIPEAAVETGSTHKAVITQRLLQRAAEHLSKTASPTGTIQDKDLSGLFVNRSSDTEIEPAYVVPATNWKVESQPLSLQEEENAKFIASLNLRPKNTKEPKPDRLIELEELLHNNISSQYKGSNVIVSKEERLEDSKWLRFAKQNRKTPAATMLGQFVSQEELIKLSRPDTEQAPTEKELSHGQ